MHGCGNDFVVLDERAAPLGLTPAGPPRWRIGAPASAATSLSPSSRRRSGRTQMPSCASATPTGRRPAPAATPRAAWRRCWPAETGRRQQVIRTVAGEPARRRAGRRAGHGGHGAGAAGLADMPLARPMDTLHLDLALGRWPIRPPAAWATRTRHSSSPTLPPCRSTPRTGAGTRPDCSPNEPISVSPRCWPRSRSGCACGSVAPG